MTVKWYHCRRSTGPSLILLNLSQAHQLPHLDSEIVNNTAR